MPFHAGLIEWVLLSAGVLCMLYAFMTDALKALPADAEDTGVVASDPVQLAGFRDWLWICGRIRVADHKSKGFN